MPEQSGRGQPQWRDKKPTVRREASREWKPGSSATGRKRLGWFGFGLAALLSLLIGVYIIFQLTRPPQPCFVAVAADPSIDCELLDVPFDIAGWRSAHRFLERARDWAGRTAWGRHPARVISGPENTPLRIPSDEQELKGWLDQFRAHDPIVMYLGVQCGTEPAREGTEPVLFVGGRNHLPVRRLLSAIAAGPLRDKNILLMLDSGRIPANPVYGQIANNFPEALRALDGEIKTCPHLVVMSGCDAEQRAWTSEELHSTAFADAIIRAMDSPTGPTDAITAAQFFDNVKANVSQWARDNRPGDQTPVLLPAGGESNDVEAHRRAESFRVGVRPSTPVESLAPAELAITLEWKEFWNRHQQLDSRSRHPAAYTPRLWRRYRELLLRYEQAMRFGEAATTSRLANAVRAAQDDLGRSIFPVDPADLPELYAFRSLRDPNIADPLSGLWEVARGRGDLPSEALRANARIRSDEWHVAAMIRHYYQSVLEKPSQPIDNWKEALDIRDRADRVALGLPQYGRGLPMLDGKPATPFSERVWPFLREKLRSIDVRRRDVEDRLFSNNPADRPSESVAPDIKKEYELLAADAANARLSFMVRDRILADLPYLTRWSASGENTNDAQVANLIAIWEQIHKLDKYLAETPGTNPRTRASELAGRAEKLLAEFTTLLSRFRTTVNDQLQAAALQQEWSAKEELLATPLIRSDQREQLLLASRKITGNLLAGATRNAGVEPRVKSRTLDPNTLAEKQIKLIRAELGTYALVTPVPADKALSRDPVRESAELAVVFKLLAPPPSDSTDLAESLSRIAIPFERESQPELEPAAVNAKLRWSQLLTDLADRAFTDHWYDESQAVGGKAYFYRLASEFLNDARRFRGSTPSDSETALRAKLDRSLPLAVQFGEQPGAIRWTSEVQRNLRFEAKVPAEMPVGRAVVFRKVSFKSETPPLAVNSDRSSSVRDILDVKPQAVNLGISLRSVVEDEIRAVGSVSVGLFYRGQQPGETRAIEVDRRPELVISDPGAKSDQSSVAIRAESDRPPAAVTVLIDFSGSMKEGLDGYRLPGPEEVWKEGPSKFNLALQRLESVLAELPKGTPLRIRLFSAKDLPDEDTLVYPGVDEKPFADWRGTDKSRLKDLMARLRRFEPFGETPLIQSIILSARADFLPETDGPRVLVVLTDGADDSGKPGSQPEERELLRKELKNALAATSIKLFVIQLALNEADKKASNELFADLPNLDTPGEVVSVADAEGLRRELVSAIWPKLVMVGGTGSSKYPPGGWPSRPEVPARGNPDLVGEMDPNGLLWSPALPSGTYLTRLSPFRAGQLPKVVLAPGDHLPLSIARQNSAFVLRRELMADSFGRSLKAFRGDRDWVMSVPGSGVEDGLEPLKYGALTFLERVPPHRRAGSSEGVEEPIRQILPGAVWWQVAPATVTPQEELAPVGWGETKTVITKLYGYAAPAWDATVEGWPRSDRTPTGFAPATIRAWIGTRPPSGQTIRIARDNIPTDGSETEINLEGRTYRLSMEKQVIARSGEKIDCLVVRAFYNPGQPIQVIPTRSDLRVASEHRYYRKANAYTAIFGPGAVNELGFEFRVLGITDLTGDPATAITITPPGPLAGRRPDGYRPTPPGEER